MSGFGFPWTPPEKQPEPVGTQYIVVYGKAPCVRVYGTAYGHNELREVVMNAEARYGKIVRTQLAKTLYPNDTVQVTTD